MFGVQQEYFSRQSQLEIGQQLDLTSTLKCDIESIRDWCRGEMLAADRLANTFSDIAPTSELVNMFFDCMKQISFDCSERMAQFSARIIRESVEMLKPGKPPCGFVVVAIGSLARGEATPYSDLEFLFLIVHKSPEIMEYFENLAVTTYFQIDNLAVSR